MDCFIFIVFLIYTSSIFLAENYFLLIAAFLVNCVIMMISRISLKKAVNNLIGIGIFVIFTVAVNFFVMGIKEAVEIGIKLLIVCNITYIFSHIMTTMRMVSALEKLLKPFGVVGIECRDIGILICIAITLIPIFQDEMKQTLYAMNSKCIKVGIKNIHLVIGPVIDRSFKRASDIEASLKAKGYS